MLFKKTSQKKKRDNKKSEIKQKKNKLHANLPLLYFLGTILAISAALPAYIQSNFLNNFVNLELLSLFFIIANIFTLFSIFLFPRAIKSFSNYSTTKFSLVFLAFSLLFMSQVNGPITALIGIIFFTVASSLLWINMDVLVETFSANVSTGLTRTIYFTFINLGWAISPTVSSWLVSLGNYQTTYSISAFLIIPVFIILSRQKKDLSQEAVYKPDNLKLIIKKTLKSKNLRGIFMAAFLLQVFYNATVIYLPVYLHQILGIPWSQLGLIFSIMLLPFLIFQIPAGIIADKYLGEKEFLYLGFSILIISLILFFSVNTVNFWFWAGVLFFSRIGASLIESMRESYFFKLVDAEDVGFINVFRTATPLGYIIGPIITMIILAFLPINYLFLFIAIFTTSAFFFIAPIKDTK